MGRNFQTRFGRRREMPNCFSLPGIKRTKFHGSRTTTVPNNVLGPHVLKLCGMLLLLLLFPHLLHTLNQCSLAIIGTSVMSLLNSRVLYSTPALSTSGWDTDFCFVALGILHNWSHTRQYIVEIAMQIYYFLFAMKIREISETFKNTWLKNGITDL